MAPWLFGCLLVGHGVTRDVTALGLTPVDSTLSPPSGHLSTPIMYFKLGTHADAAAAAASHHQAASSTSGSAVNTSSSSNSSIGIEGRNGRPDGGGHTIVKGVDGSKQLSASLIPAYDTKSFPGFQSRSGSAFTLQRLARDHLGRNIQQPRQQPLSVQDTAALQHPPRARQQSRIEQDQRTAAVITAPGRRGTKGRGGRGARSSRGAGRPALHDAVEDARAVMELFVKVVRPQLLLNEAAAAACGPAAMVAPGLVIGDSLGADAAYARLVELHTAALLAARSGRDDSVHNGGDA